MKDKDFINTIKKDYYRNKNNPKGFLVVFLFRLAHALRCSKYKIVFYISIPYLIFYRVFVEWLLCIELPFKTIVGAGLVIHHGAGLVVHSNCVIGENVTLRQGVTIGIKNIGNFSDDQAPVIGNDVNIGANSIILGPIIIGDSVIIGAGSVVLKSVLASRVVAGNPARVIL